MNIIDFKKKFSLKRNIYFCKKKKEKKKESNVRKVWTLTPNPIWPLSSIIDAYLYICKYRNIYVYKYIKYENYFFIFTETSDYIYRLKRIKINRINKQKETSSSK